jgi:hypothetical protein
MISTGLDFSTDAMQYSIIIIITIMIIIISSSLKVSLTWCLIIINESDSVINLGFED